METKQLIEETVKHLSTLPINEQVAVFNEIKFSLLNVRKQMYECNQEAIAKASEQNELILGGNKAISGEHDAEVKKGY